MSEPPSEGMTPPPLLATVLEHRYGELRRYALQKSGSPSMADDVMQDAWLRLLDQGAAKALDADTIKNPLAYIRRVIANLVIDRQRQITAQSKHVSAKEIPEDIAAEGPSAFQVVASQQEFAVLQEAISDLPDKCRQVFLLYRINQLSMKEVANRLGISAKTVENHLAHAMTHCRRRLRAVGRKV